MRTWLRELRQRTKVRDWEFSQRKQKERTIYINTYLNLGTPMSWYNFDRAPSTKLLGIFLPQNLVYDLLALIQSNFPFSVKKIRRIE